MYVLYNLTNKFNINILVNNIILNKKYHKLVVKNNETGMFEIIKERLFFGLHKNH